MTRPEETHPLSSGFYQIALVLLAGAVLVLGWMLFKEQPAPPPADAPAAVASQAAPQAPAQRAVALFDMTSQAQELIRARIGAPDASRSFFESSFGTVRLEVMGAGRMQPLHLRRATHEVYVPLTEGLLLSHAVGGDLADMGSLAPGALAYWPPYSGRQLRNASQSQEQAWLVFTSPPVESDTVFYLERQDPRLELGSAPALFDPDQALQAPQEQAPGSWMDGKLAVLLVSDRALLASHDGPTIAYVARGRGSLELGGKHELRAKNLAIIAPGHEVSLEAEPGSPLAIYLFKPTDDGTSAILREGKKLYSQANEELLIREQLQDRRGGFFLDVGAGHWQRDSTTLYLEQHLDWSGIGIDALAEYQADYEKHRPKTRFRNFLITDKPQGLQKFYRADGYLEVSSAKADVARDQAEFFKGDGSVTELEVRSANLNEVLALEKIERIDFLSMDIEEYEPAALAGFDIQRYRPQLVCIEAHGTVQDAIYRYFLDNGYQRIDAYLPYDPYNWYFTPREKTP